MGKCIGLLSKWAESFSDEQTFLLRICGYLITIFVVGLSGIIGWSIERLALPGSLIPQWLGILFLLFGLASGIATGSLNKAVNEVLNTLPKDIKDQNLSNARESLKQLVGREVDHLNQEEILRATAESASENAVDGVFSPIFWMFFGATLWTFSTSLPGPLSLVWIFKAASTIDSMIGYRNGKFLYLGQAGAKLDDALTWIPCRLVLITLPMICKPIKQIPKIINNAYKEGKLDQSPNSGLSEAIFAHCIGITMGGENNYKGEVIKKPILAKKGEKANRKNIKELMNLIVKLEIYWLVIIMFLTIQIS